MEDSSQLNQDEEAFLREQLQASHDDDEEQGPSADTAEQSHSHSSSQEQPPQASSCAHSAEEEQTSGSAQAEENVDGGQPGTAEHDEDEKPTQQLNLEAPLAWQLQAEHEAHHSGDQPDREHRDQQAPQHSDQGPQQNSDQPQHSDQQASQHSDQQPLQHSDQPQYSDQQPQQQDQKPLHAATQQPQQQEDQEPPLHSATQHPQQQQGQQPPLPATQHPQQQQGQQPPLHSATQHPQLQQGQQPPLHSATQPQRQKKHPGPKPRSSASGSSMQGLTQHAGDGVSSVSGYFSLPTRSRSPKHVHGAKPPPVYVVAPPAIVLDPAVKPQDVVGMAGQRNPQPCAYRHARKLASTYEVEHQLAELFQECHDQGEETLAARLHAVDSLCRKYNQTAMSLLETRAYRQARDLLQKAQVLCEEGGVLAAHPRLRQRLEAITLNNLGCLHCRCLNLPAALKAIEAAARIEQQLLANQSQESEGEQALAAMHHEAAEGLDGKGPEGFDDVSEDPCSTLLNMCAVLGMMGQHKEALAKAKEAASMLCRNNDLDQSQVEAWGHAYAPSNLPAHMPHKKFGHDPHTGRPYTAPLPPPLSPRLNSAAPSLASMPSSPQNTSGLNSALTSPLASTSPLSPPTATQPVAGSSCYSHTMAGNPSPTPYFERGLGLGSTQQHGQHTQGQHEQPHSTLQPLQHPSNHTPQHSPQHNMRARAHQPSPLGLPPSTAHSTLSSLSGLQPSRPNTQQLLSHQRRASPHFNARLHQGLREESLPEPHHPHQNMPVHSHSHHIQEFGGRSSPPALPPNSRVGEYKRYYVEKRKQKKQENNAHSFYHLFAQPPSTSSTFSPVGLPATPLPPNAPLVAYKLRSMPPGRVNLLTMAYFTKGVQSEHLGELHDAFHAYSLAASLPAKVFGRSSHIAVRFNKAFHAFNVKHKRYFSRQQEQEQQRVREQEMREMEELARSHGMSSIFNPAQRRKTSLASLLGTRVCHPTPESLVRKQILDSYAQDYEPMPPQPEPMPSSAELMQAHMNKVKLMKQCKLVFL